MFRAVGSEAVELEGGAVQALKFVREPRGEYDTRVEVWLDLARHALPVRARLQNGAEDAAFELRLRQLTLAP